MIVGEINNSGLGVGNGVFVGEGVGVEVGVGVWVSVGDGGSVGVSSLISDCEDKTSFFRDDWSIRLVTRYPSTDPIKNIPVLNNKNMALT